MKPLKGKIALVTGGSRGAGRAIAAELGKAGATVYITGRSIRGASTNQWPGTIDDTVSQIEASGGKAIAVRCDHTNDAETEAVIAKIREEQGKLDILINNVWGRTIWVSRQSLLGIVIEKLGYDVRRRGACPAGDKPLRRAAPSRK